MIIPVYNGAETLDACLCAVRRALQGVEAEIIVADDASTDGTVEIAKGRGAKVSRAAERSGPAAARNRGVRASKGEVLAFVDSDVVIPPDAFQRAASRMRNGGWDGVIGIVSPRPCPGPWAGRVKNHWMHYTYSRLPEQAPLFLTCFATITREAFSVAGGFDENYREPSVEDTDLGHRFAEAGFRVFVDVGLEVEHLRAMTLRDVLRLDRDRAAGLIRLALRERNEGRAMKHAFSVPMEHYVSVTASGFSALFLLLTPIFRNFGPVVAALFCQFVALAAASPFPLYLARRRERGLAAAACAYLLIDNMAALAGVVSGAVGFHRGRTY